MARSLGELAAQFGCDLVGDPSVTVTQVATLANATAGQLSFFANKAYREQLQNTRAAVVILRKEDADECPVPALLADDPYLAYALIATELYAEPAARGTIHPAAVISETASVSPGAEISAHVTIEAGAHVGDNTYLAPGVYVGPRCHIGSHTRILANATLVQDVVVGDRCIVHPGAVLGSDGFGNAMSPDGWIKVPQVGGLRIGNDVEIGANTTIDRGAIDDTEIGNGVRLDNLVQIGHNVKVGAHTAMAAFVGVSGSTTIGERCMFAGRAGIVGHIRICDDVVVGGATVITKDITEPGFYNGTFAGEKDRDWKRKVARFRRLEDLVKRVARLEKKAVDKGE